ncbi:MAG: hypothetical protein K2K83_03485, partial [Rikenella sp.]|nr:hypothetical protein [Rikenella sp.]
MKKISLLGALAAVALTFSCTRDPYAGLEPGLAEDLRANIEAADSSNRAQLLDALTRVPKDQHEG